MAANRGVFAKLTRQPDLKRTVLQPGDLGPAVPQNRKFQTGWGRNSSSGAPLIHLSNKGAILSPDQSNRSRRACLCKIDQGNKEFRGVCLIPGIGSCGLAAPESAERPARASFRALGREHLLHRSVIWP